MLCEITTCYNNSFTLNIECLKEIFILILSVLINLIMYIDLIPLHKSL